EERLGARLRLGLAFSGRAQHHPRHLELGIPVEEREDRPAAADLQVVGVTADGEDALEPACERDAAHLRLVARWIGGTNGALLRFGAEFATHPLSSIGR